MAMKPKKVTSDVQYVIRPGEGIPLEVSHLPATSSQQARSSVNLGSANVPDRRYTCDVANVFHSDIEVQLVFSQRKIAGSGLRSLLAVHLSFDAVHTFVDSLGAFDNWSKDLSAAKIAPHKLTPIDEEPAQTVSLSANQAVVGFAGREACMDFYYTSAFALHQLPHATHMPVEPVVRVLIATSLMWALVNEVKRIAPMLPGRGEAK